ncbi:glycosyltransferase [Halostella sp. JP-L12]|uniref:glycosyltransferase n=1 Tax=Halostella TaxID=1843185 RepID=UPI000EF85309|nr:MULTISPECIES: glycosyltransferase [Halostella]NHN47131.1 glycosyltransferase [Halostella sp. JP-L12]
MDDGDPQVSFVVPAREEAAYLPSTLSSIRDQATDRDYEAVVVVGGRRDGTAEIARDYGARVYRQAGRGIGDARHIGAEHARGEWLAFVDADTALDPSYLETMLAHVGHEGLDAASSRCRMTGPRRAKLVEWTINHVFPRLEWPVLPGFNFFVDAETYRAAGGFPNVPNEDTAFSRRLGRSVETGYCPAVLVESSGRRVAAAGLTGTLYHYLRLDWGRVRANY